VFETSPSGTEYFFRFHQQVNNLCLLRRRAATENRWTCTQITRAGDSVMQHRLGLLPV